MYLIFLIVYSVNILLAECVDFGVHSIRKILEALLAALRLTARASAETDWRITHFTQNAYISWVHEAHSFRVLLEGSRCRSAVYVYSGGRYCHHHHHRHGMIVMRHKTSEERIHSREDHNLLRVVVKCPQGAAVVGPKQVVQPGGEVSWPPHGTDNRARRLIYICFIYH